MSETDSQSVSSTHDSDTLSHSDSTVNALSIITPLNVHASFLQRPSVTNVDDNMHVFRISDDVPFNFETSHGNMVTQHSHSNQSSDMPLASGTLSNDIIQSSTQGSQQVSDHQTSLSDTQLSITTSVSSNELVCVRRFPAGLH